MRVNELAKEIGKTSKELLTILNEKGMEAKSHLANLTEEQLSYLKTKFDIKGQDNNKSADNGEEKSKEAVQKKKYTAVFRPQNSQQAKNHKKADSKQKSTRVLNVVKNDKKEETDSKAEVREANTDEKASELNIGTTVKTDLNGAMQEKSDKNIESVKSDVYNNSRTDIETEKMEVTKEKEDKNVTNVETVAKMQDNNINSKQRNSDFNNRATSQRDNTRENNRYNNRNSENRGYENRNNKPDRSRSSDNRSFDRNKDNRSFERNKNSSSFNRNDRNQGRPENGERTFNRNSENRGTFNRGDRNSDNRNTGRNSGNFRQNGQGQAGYQGRNNSFGAGFNKDKDEQTQRPQRSTQRKDTSKPAPIDTGLTKRTNTRVNKNNFKNQKDDKKHRVEDGPAKGVKVSRHPFIKPVKQKVEVVQDDIKEIVLPERITIKDFAAKLKLQPSVIVKKLFLKGQMVTLNSELTFEEAEEIALEYDVICTPEEKIDVIAELLKEDEESEDTMVKRPPVVCVMGHVDHGKTSLLDAIRKANVTSHEAGGITQHIGAYMVRVGNEPITFLDTPGHEAFTAMRMRGAMSTDIAILVVAADDGVKPQTIEAINHAKAAGVEIIVAVNKIDKPTANIEKVKQELSEYELIPEDWGGSTIFCPVSAKSKEGLENLLEMVILAAEVRELKANPDRKARGLVIEAELDKGKGPVATILVQKGTLRVGDFVAAGACSGKVRAMMNENGQRVKEATPSMPVEILGLDSVPNAGEVLVATENDKEAKAFAATFISEGKNKLIEETKAKLSLDDLFNQIQAGNVKELPLIVKADVQGSVEAVKQSLTKLSNEEVQVKVIHGAVGAINESDVSLAAASNAIIIGFNVKPEATAKLTADREKVDLRLYKVIYKAIEDIETAMNGMLAPVYEERVLGHAEIRQLFKASGIGTIAGSYVLDGKFVRGCKVRITRDGEQIFDGNLASLKRFKDDVKEVKEGYECGLVFEKFNDIMELDLVEAYDMVEVPRK